jgi:hypothetical protein
MSPLHGEYDAATEGKPAVHFEMAALLSAHRQFSLKLLHH